MKTASKTQKRIALAFGLVVSLLLVFAGENTSQGEEYHNATLMEIDEDALFERAIEEMEEEYYTPEMNFSKTIKIFNQDYELLDIIYLNDNGEVDDVYSKQLLNQSEFLSEYGNTAIYKVTE